VLWAKRAWRWGAGSFLQVKELIEKETTGQKQLLVHDVEPIGYVSHLIHF